jgi:hypothetical protein
MVLAAEIFFVPPRDRLDSTSRQIWRMTLRKSAWTDSLSFLGKSKFLGKAHPMGEGIILWDDNPA